MGTRHRTKTKTTIKEQSRMDNPETHVIMGTRHRTKTNIATKEQSRMDNPETQVIMGTRHRAKTNIKNGQSRNTGNNGHKTQNEDKHNNNTTQKTKIKLILNFLALFFFTMYLYIFRCSRHKVW
jgi:D-tyrosyl-tRNA(Tyr) deacylase